MNGYGEGLYGGGAYGETYLPDTPAVGSLLDRFVGTQALTITVAGSVVPLTDAGFVTIKHGRAGIDQQPEAATCTVTVRASALPELPELGDTLDVQLGPDAVVWLGNPTGPALDAIRDRFTGTLTDIAVRPEGRNLAGPGLVSLTGVSRRARLGRTYVGDAPWPAESDGARAARILALVADQVDTDTVDPGTVTLLGRDVDRQTALGLLDALAFQANGQLAEHRNGSFDWHDADHRRTTTPLLTLDASSVLAPAVASKSFAGLVNDLTVTYGNPADTVRVTAPSSIARYGPLAAAVTTELADTADASSFATQAVARLSVPAYEFGELAVDLLRSVTADDVTALLAVEQASLLALSGFPESGPFRAAQVWVEGWAETLGRDRWRLALNVVGYGRGVPALRWSDVDPDLTWAEVDPDRSWLDARQTVTT